MEQETTIHQRLEKPKKEERMLGMDVLKILSMFMVLLLHVNGAGGILWNATTFETHWWIAHAMEHICIVAVNLFAMASGFLCFGRKWQIKKLLALWLQVFFYCLTITVIFMAIEGTDTVTWGDFGKAFIPVLDGQYWYFTSYFLLFFAIPMLNWAIERFTKRQALFFLGVIGFLLTIGTSIGDAFSVRTGYNAFWLGYLYLIGAFVKKYDFNFRVGKKGVPAWAYAILYLALVTVGLLRMAHFHKYYDESPQYGYTFPLHFLGSVALFLCFSRIKKRSNKVVAVLSNAAFGVFLIHTHDFTMECLSGSIKEWLEWDPWGMLGGMLLLALLIYLTCTIIEILRQLLFKGIRIPKLLNWIQKKFDIVFEKKDEEREVSTEK